MSERQHALQHFLKRAARASARNDGVRIEVRPGLEHINLRGDPADESFLKTVQGLLDQRLPVVANTMSVGAQTIYWLGPDEWLLLADRARGEALAKSLETALLDMHGTVNILSGGQIAMRMIGAESAVLLAKGCTLDLHARSFSVGECAQTGLGKASILIGKIDEQPRFELIVRRSFAEYLALWLQQAGREYGVGFSIAE